MSVVGLHPEDLFDKLFDGEITPPERERLVAHLDTCEVCRFEYAARLDFQGEALEVAALGPPPTLPLRPLGDGQLHAPVVMRRRRRSRLAVWGLAAAALITASGAVAASVSGNPPWQAVSQLFTPSKAPAEPVKKAQAPAPVSVARTSARASVEAPGNVDDVAPTPIIAAVAENTAPRPMAKPKRADKTALAVSSPGVVEAESLTSLVTKEPAPIKEPSSAAKLFGEANQARRSGDVGRASGLYHLLQDQYGGSPEAELSRVTLALLLLDGGDARGALSGFERYLAGSSRALEAEALVGRARALGRLGKRDQEAAAWREVQRKYPRSIYGRQATERLAALGQP
jgi:TolA-binding protein